MNIESELNKLILKDPCLENFISKNIYNDVSVLTDVYHGEGRRKYI